MYQDWQQALRLLGRGGGQVAGVDRARVGKLTAPTSAS
jgi:hypothetical protein